jgi:hypothetical protein
LLQQLLNERKMMTVASQAKETSSSAIIHKVSDHSTQILIQQLMNGRKTGATSKGKRKTSSPVMWLLQMPQILRTTAALVAMVGGTVVVVTVEDMAVVATVGVDMVVEAGVMVGMAVVDGVAEGAVGVVVEGDGKGAIGISNPREKEPNALGLGAREYAGKYYS